MCARGRARLRAEIPSSTIFSTPLRGSTRLERGQVLVLVELISSCSDSAVSKALCRSERIKSERAHAARDRIFLHRRHHIFVVGTLQTRTHPLETRRESSDSRQVIRLRVRRRGASSAPRS